jgi:hypothetical protein
MTNESQRIRDIFRVLGQRQQRTLLESIETPFMYRSKWQCGCAVDYIDANVGPFVWARCADHRDHEGALRRSRSRRPGPLASPGAERRAAAPSLHFLALENIDGDNLDEPGDAAEVGRVSRVERKPA